ncbi:MAG: ABC transporter permease [Rhodospirillales bacterium]
MMRPGAPGWFEKSGNPLGVRTLFKREITRFLRFAGYSLAGPVITTLLYLAVFVLAVDDVRMIAGVEFGTFLIPGLVMMAIVQESFDSAGIGMVDDKMEGTIADVLTPPLTPLEIMLALTAAGVSRGLIVGALIFAAAAVFIPVGVHDWALAAAFAALGALMFTMLGLAAGIWAEKWDQLEAWRAFLVIPAAFLSATFYSLGRLPETAQELMAFNPVFYLMDGMRAGVIGHAEAAPGLGLAVVSAAAAGLWLTVFAMLKSGYKLKK